MVVRISFFTNSRICVTPSSSLIGPNRSKSYTALVLYRKNRPTKFQRNRMKVHPKSSSDHQYSMKELVENPVNPIFRWVMAPNPPPKCTDRVKNLENIIFHSQLSTYWISKKSVVRFSFSWPLTPPSLGRIGPKAIQL